jgi:hypothetical protein
MGLGSEPESPVCQTSEAPAKMKTLLGNIAIGNVKIGLLLCEAVKSSSRAKGRRTQDISRYRRENFRSHAEILDFLLAYFL